VSETSITQNARNVLPAARIAAGAAAPGGCEFIGSAPTRLSVSFQVVDERIWIRLVFHTYSAMSVRTTEISGRVFTR
jgi:hypothetical protein